MWIDLFINGKVLKSWLVNDIEQPAFSPTSHNERKAHWEKLIDRCVSDASDIIVDCRSYCFCVRVKSVMDCKTIEPIAKKAHHEQWQVEYLQDYSGKKTLEELVDGTGLTKSWIYDYLRKNELDYKRKYKPNAMLQTAQLADRIGG